MASVVAMFPETPNLTELAESVDDALFQRIMHNPSYITCSLNLYISNIRPRQHDGQLSIIFLVSCAIGILVTLCCLKTVFYARAFIRILRLFVILYRCILSFFVINEYVGLCIFKDHICTQGGYV